MGALPVPEYLPTAITLGLCLPRYQTALVLVRVKQEEGGFYTIRASNEDDEQEISFHLQINGEDGHALTWLRRVGAASRGGTILCCRTLRTQPLLLWLQLQSGLA